ncbi:MAG: PIN-like domain-containing protein [Dolichospermum sp.]
MLNKQSIEIYTLSDDREKRLWQDCIFVFDTSALLEFYLYSDKTREDIFETIFPKLINRLWIPQQVEYEYLKNRENVIKKPIQKYKNLIDKNPENKDSGNLPKIEDSIEKIKKEIKTISTQFQTLKESTTKQDKHPYLDRSLIDNLDTVMIDCNESIEAELNKFKNSIEEFKEEIRKEISNRQNEIQAIYQSDSVLDGFNKYFEVGEGYTFDEIMEIIKEGELRYRSKIPPGYKDQGNKHEDNEGKKGKEGISIYGDLILWKQIIAHAKKVKKPIILIINDIKEDWCYKKEQRIEKPREDLIRELYTITGMELWMYTFSDFLYTADKLLSTSVDNEVLEEVKEIEKEKQKDKLIVFCEGKTDFLILEFLSE